MRFTINARLCWEYEDGFRQRQVPHFYVEEDTPDAALEWAADVLLATSPETGCVMHLAAGGFDKHGRWRYGTATFRDGDRL